MSKELKWILIAFVLQMNGARAIYPEYRNVTTVSLTKFNDIFETIESVCVLQFVVPWCEHCKSFVPEYEKAAYALKGIASVYAINAEKHRDLIAKLRIKSYPTIHIYGDNLKAVKFTENRTTENIIAAVTQAIKNRITLKSYYFTKAWKANIIELIDSDFEKTVINSSHQWLVYFYKPLSKECRAFAPQWIRIAKVIDNIFMVGAMDMNKYPETADNHQIHWEDYAIRLFVHNVRKRKTPLIYKGNYTEEDIVDWALKVSGLKNKTKVFELVDLWSARQACETKKLCFISVLPNLTTCQKECKLNYLNTIKQLIQEFKSQKWGWLWFETGMQPYIEDALKLTNLPALIVVDYYRSTYAVTTEFSLENLKKYLNELKDGTVRTQLNIDYFPDILTTENSVDYVELSDFL